MRADDRMRYRPSMVALGRTSVLSLLSLVTLAACEREPRPVRATAIAVVVQGDEVYWGNDQHRTPDNCNSPEVVASGAPCRITKISSGIFADLGASMPAVVGAASRGIDIAVLAYSDQVDVKYDGPIAGLTAESLGTQADQGGHVGRERVAALDAALDRLELSPSGRRKLDTLGRVDTLRQAVELRTALPAAVAR